MQKYIFLLLIYFVFSTSMVIAQEYTTVSESRKENLISILNYRYKGGFYTLEKDFTNTVSYPEAAKYNCRIGICIASLYVDCDGVVQEVSIKNPLRLGLDEEIQNFFNSTLGNWNNCDDEKYMKFEIPIQFTLTGTETNTTDALLIHVGEGTPGSPCNGDEYYVKKAEKMLEKKNGKKAMPYINLLLMRDPYNTKYYDMRKEAVGYIENK